MHSSTSPRLLRRGKQARRYTNQAHRIHEPFEKTSVLSVFPPDEFRYGTE
jgi:hypothetical protein